MKIERRARLPKGWMSPISLIWEAPEGRKRPGVEALASLATSFRFVSVALALSTAVIRRDNLRQGAKEPPNGRQPVRKRILHLSG